MSILKFMRRACFWAICLSCCPLRGEISLIGDLLEQFDSLPGGVYNGSFTIRNIGSTTENVSITITDYTYKADGTNYFHESTANPAHPRSNSLWIDLDTQKALIPPGEERVVRYSVNIPKDQSLKGTFWSVLLVQPEIEIVETSQGVTLTPIFRYAVQIMNHLREGSKASLTVEKDQIQLAPDRVPSELAHLEGKTSKDQEIADVTKNRHVVYAVDVLNSGELGLNPEISIQVFDAEGNSVFEGKRAKAWLLPDCSVRANFDLSALASGKYSAIIGMDAGGENFMGETREISVP